VYVTATELGPDFRSGLPASGGMNMAACDVGLVAGRHHRGKPACRYWPTRGQAARQERIPHAAIQENGELDLCIERPPGRYEAQRVAGSCVPGVGLDHRLIQIQQAGRSGPPPPAPPAHFHRVGVLNCGERPIRAQGIEGCRARKRLDPGDLKGGNERQVLGRQSRTALASWSPAEASSRSVNTTIKLRRCTIARIRAAANTGLDSLGLRTTCGEQIADATDGRFTPSGRQHGERLGNEHKNTHCIVQGRGTLSEASGHIDVEAQAIYFASSKGAGAACIDCHDDRFGQRVGALELVRISAWR
jgi:hypothetical protein